MANKSQHRLSGNLGVYRLGLGPVDQPDGIVPG